MIKRFMQCGRPYPQNTGKLQNVIFGFGSEPLSLELFVDEYDPNLPFLLFPSDEGILHPNLRFRIIKYWNTCGNRLYPKPAAFKNRGMGNIVVYKLEDTKNKTYLCARFEFGKNSNPGIHPVNGDLSGRINGNVTFISWPQAQIIFAPDLLRITEQRWKSSRTKPMELPDGSKVYYA